MSNLSPNRTTHLYNLTRELKTVLHYEFDKTQRAPVILSREIKLSKDPSYFLISGIPYTFHQKESKKWSKAITGLEPIAVAERVYYGSISTDNKKSLVIFQFNKNLSQLIIDVFKGFYPKDKESLRQALSEHSYYYQ